MTSIVAVNAVGGHDVKVITQELRDGEWVTTNEHVVPRGTGHNDATHTNQRLIFETLKTQEEIEEETAQHEHLKDGDFVDVEENDPNNNKEDGAF